MLARLVDEHGVDITYSTVRDYVRVRRPEIWAESGRLPEQAVRAADARAGGEAEVDFADLWVVLREVKTKVFLFTLRLSFPGKAVHRAFASQAQEPSSRAICTPSTCSAAFPRTRSVTTT